MYPDYLFVDFDETIFNHSRFVSWLDSRLFADGHITSSKGTFSTTIDEYHEIVHENPRMRLYHHDEHIREVSGKTWDFMSGVIEAMRRRDKEDFCYQDAHHFIESITNKVDYETSVLTFGDDDYQRFKIQLCDHPKLSELPVLVTDIVKSDFLAQNFPTGEGVLIDDKPGLGLPKNWKHIWLNRDEKLLMPKLLSPRVIQISGLDQAVAALDLF